MRVGLPVVARDTAGAPVAPFVRLTALWIQITGTWCNLECTHCLNASGPREPWLAPLDAETARRAIARGRAAGREGDLLHRRRAVPAQGDPAAARAGPGGGADHRPHQRHRSSPRRWPTRSPRWRAAADYSLEIRVSLDDVGRRAATTASAGAGAWAKAVRAVRLLRRAGPGADRHRHRDPATAPRACYAALPRLPARAGRGAGPA